MLSEMLEKGKQILEGKDFGLLLEGVETGFVLKNNRRIFEKYTFQRAITCRAIMSIPMVCFSEGAQRF